MLHLSDAMARAAREIGSPRDLPSALDTIVDVARRSMPGIDHVGVTLAHRKGRLETVAATDQLVRDLDDLQYGLGEGPCVHAMRSDPVVVVETARHEQRWPRYIPEAVRRGLRSQLGLRLFVEAEETLGGLNLYSTSSDAIHQETRQLAEVFAAQVAVALKHVLLEETLSTALESRTMIGTAVGIIMERYDLDNERAFGYLSRVSQHSNVKLKDVAAGIVTGVRHAPDAAPSQGGERVADLDDPRPRLLRDTLTEG
jgi:GAF domain-containing protein